MKLYHLSVTFALSPVASHGGTFDFVARDDEEARLLIDNFSRVCQPTSLGPLLCVGEMRTQGGIEAIWRYEDERDHRFVPLGITQT